MKDFELNVVEDCLMGIDRIVYMYGFASVNIRLFWI